MKTSFGKICVLVAVLFSGLAFFGTASAHDWVWMGDYVWADADCDGVQNEGADAGLNWIKVLFWRDYDCNGFVDGADEFYDYDYTHDDAFGNPGYYDVPADGGYCFVVELDATTIPDGLHVTTNEEVSVKLNGFDYWDADFGLGACDETPEYACPKTIGFWKQQVLQTSAKKYTLAEVNSIIEEALTLTPVFTSAADLKTALLSNGTAGALQRAFGARRLGRTQAQPDQ